MDFIELMDFCGYDLEKANEIIRKDKRYVDIHKLKPLRKECRGLFGAGCVGCLGC